MYQITFFILALVATCKYIFEISAAGIFATQVHHLQNREILNPDSILLEDSFSVLLLLIRKTKFQILSHRDNLII